MINRYTATNMTAAPTAATNCGSAIKIPAILYAPGKRNISNGPEIGAKNKLS